MSHAIGATRKVVLTPKIIIQDQSARRGPGRPKKIAHAAVSTPAPVVTVNVSNLALSDRLLPKRDVMKLLGICHSSVYRWIKAGQFPLPVQLGPRRVAWRASDIAAFMASRKTVAA